MSAITVPLGCMSRTCEFKLHYLVPNRIILMVVPTIPANMAGLQVQEENNIILKSTRTRITSSINLIFWGQENKDSKTINRKRVKVTKN